MKIHVFAVLKDYMPAEQELKTGSVTDIASLKEALKKQYPSAGVLLDSCRFSSEKEILSLDKIITDYEHIYVIPPSSGG